MYTALYWTYSLSIELVFFAIEKIIKYKKNTSDKIAGMCEKCLKEHLKILLLHPCFIGKAEI